MALERIVKPHIRELAPYQPVRQLVTVSLLVMLAFQVVFFINFFWSLRRGERAGRNPWRANTLEWTTESPPPHGNWGKDLPVVYRWAYDYSVPGADQDFLPQNQPGITRAALDSPHG